jgi:pimeloyl-ACP methyl ester carboxylesterase
VLILPGIMGSTLGRTRKLLPDDLLWFDPLEIALGRLTDLALPSRRRLEPLGALMFGYAPLERALRQAGLAAAIHPYDWRCSIAAAGARLAARLEQQGLTDVALVAHSMGGLVARAALAAPGGARIARVVQLGTPNRGAYVAVQALRGSYPLVRRIAALDLAHDAAALARKVFATLDGLAELLPAEDACEGFDPFTAAD